MGDELPSVAQSIYLIDDDIVCAIRNNGVNDNHSTGYSMIGYTCAYLRYYYPKEFITAYLNNANNEDDISMGTELANQLNIPIHSIKFRYSLSEYACDDTGIYKGIESIKFCNSKIADELYALRHNK